MLIPDCVKNCRWFSIWQMANIKVEIRFILKACRSVKVEIRSVAERLCGAEMEIASAEE
jgi:hypothetical protein